MSLNFSANQFQEEYIPSRLCNWEVPKWFPERPCQNHGKTHVLSNERGHLLPGVPRSTSNPWGNFVGTWDLPKKISQRMAVELSAPDEDRISRWNAHCLRTHTVKSKKGLRVKKLEKSEIEANTGEDDEIVQRDNGEETGGSVKSEPLPEIFCPIHDLIL